MLGDLHGRIVAPVSTGGGPGSMQAERVTALLSGTVSLGQNMSCGSPGREGQRCEGCRSAL
jgi:hypothetical protein